MTKNSAIALFVVAVVVFLTTSVVGTLIYTRSQTASAPSVAMTATPDTTASSTATSTAEVPEPSVSAQPETTTTVPVVPATAESPQSEVSNPKDVGLDEENPTYLQPDGQISLPTNFKVVQNNASGMIATRNGCKPTPKGCEVIEISMTGDDFGQYDRYMRGEITGTESREVDTYSFTMSTYASSDSSGVILIPGDGDGESTFVPPTITAYTTGDDVIVPDEMMESILTMYFEALGD